MMQTDVKSTACANAATTVVVNGPARVKGMTISYQSGGVVAIANGGTGQSTQAAGFNALSPMTTAGDIIYGGTSGAGTRLAAGTTTQVLHGGTTPSWSAVSLTADVSGTLPVANGGTGVTTSTGSGNNVLSAAPTLTGTTTIGATNIGGSTVGRNLSVATTAASPGPCVIDYNNTAATDVDLLLRCQTAGTSAWSFILCQSDSTLYTQRFQVRGDGYVLASSSIAANSDIRLKKNIKVIPDALEKVSKISGYTYDRIDLEGRHAGVIAQEMIEVLPEVVDKGDDGMYAVSYGNIVALLIEALKEEKKKREELEIRIQKLEDSKIM